IHAKKAADNRVNYWKQSKYDALTPVNRLTLRQKRASRMKWSFISPRCSRFFPFGQGCPFSGSSGIKQAYSCYFTEHSGLSCAGGVTAFGTVTSCLRAPTLGDSVDAE